jgi:hypothetical protein
LAEDLDMCRLGSIATGGYVNPSGNLSLKKRNFVWMDVWELKTKLFYIIAYMTVQSVPQREHYTSPLQRSTG